MDITDFCGKLMTAFSTRLATYPASACPIRQQRGTSRRIFLTAKLNTENLNTQTNDEIAGVSNETANETGRAAASVEGQPVGISSCAALACPFGIGKRPTIEGRLVALIIPRFAERDLLSAPCEASKERAIWN